MRGAGNGKKLSPAREIAYIAVAVALLIGGQYVFSFVVGVEVVTILLVCFSFSFGVRRGVICAVAFSLLRCLFYGFNPAVVLLYLIYYPLLAAVFGALGKIKEGAFGSSAICLSVVNILLLGLAAACALCYFTDAVKISRLDKRTVNALLWVVFAITVILCAAFDGLFIAENKFKKRFGSALRLITLTSVAVIMTICFTLFDDVITPLVYGFSKESALGYFYTSFTAMLPQSVCTAVTVATLFEPLTATLKRVR